MGLKIRKLNLLNNHIECIYAFRLIQAYGKITIFDRPCPIAGQLEYETYPRRSNNRPAESHGSCERCGSL